VCQRAPGRKLAAQRMRAPESLRSVSQIPTLPAAPIADRLITQTNASLRPGHRAAMPSRCRCLLSRYCAGHYREPAAFRFCPREVGWRWAAGIHFWRWLNCGVRFARLARRQVQILARSVTGRAEEVPASRGAAFSRYEHKAGFKRDGGESPVLLVGEPTNDFAHVQRATFLNCEVVPLRKSAAFKRIVHVHVQPQQRRSARGFRRECMCACPNGCEATAAAIRTAHSIHPIHGFFSLEIKVREASE
jgi:hypothetical protein